MRAGKLNRKIIIQTPTRDQNAIGEGHTWAAFATVWASVNPLSGTERFDNEREHAEARVRFNLRYIPGILPSMRISYDSKIYDIQSIMNWHDARREIEIITIEIVQ